ncbi:MAG: thiamine biosynthesis protein ThiF [Lachnospiraceae bacterium]|nr:thiamine biosynthesis protein ThiF [Lachnospiraceae bacterium]
MIPTKEAMQAALAKRIGRKLWEKVSSACVAVCGLGGLGSNIAVMLARAGVGKLCLIDFDKVDISNLNRQQYKAGQLGMYKTEALSEVLLEIAPYIEIETHTVRMDERNTQELLRDADIICEAFDVAEAKAMLTDIVLTGLPDKYLVSASGMAGMGDANNIKTRKITEHFFICGDGVSEVTEGEGLVSSRVMLCAAHQAHKALQLIEEIF